MADLMTSLLGWSCEPFSYARTEKQGSFPYTVVAVWTAEGNLFCACVHENGESFISRFDSLVFMPEISV